MHLIVGIDPGKTSALVCLDLSGRLVYATHKTFAGVEWFIEEISRTGTPSLIACDRAPDYVARKISAAFNVRIHFPQNEGSVLAKREYARRFNIQNPHERDACYAAMKAYNHFSNKLHQAEHIAREQSARIDDIQAKVMDRYSIEEAINNKTANRR